MALPVFFHPVRVARPRLSCCACRHHRQASAPGAEHGRDGMSPELPADPNAYDVSPPPRRARRWLILASLAAP